MSPSKYQHNGDLLTVAMLNGARHLPYRINKDSHAIQKQQQNPPVSKHSSRRQPVIIYTHSPKVIHAQAQDFMALVQKLTGMSRSDDEVSKSEVDSSDKNAGLDEHENGDSSVVTDDKMIGEMYKDSYAVSSIYNASDPCFIDAPLFVPSMNEYHLHSFGSKPVFRSHERKGLP